MVRPYESPHKDRQIRMCLCAFNSTNSYVVLRIESWQRCRSAVTVQAQILICVRYVIHQLQFHRFLKEEGEEWWRSQRRLPHSDDVWSRACGLVQHGTSSDRPLWSFFRPLGLCVVWETSPDWECLIALLRFGLYPNTQERREKILTA